MIKNILIGVNAYFSAYRLISKLSLWKYFFIPIVISIVTAVIIFGLAFSFSDNLGSFISKVWIWDWGKDVFSSIGTFIGGLIIIAFGIIFYKHLIMAFSAPFMSPVSEKIEAHLLGENHSHTNSTFSEQLWRGIRLNTRNLFMELLLTIPILLLKFIPGINIISTVLLFLVQGYYAGFGSMDYTLERHFNYKDSIRFVRKHRGLAIGNGLLFLFMLLTPVVGIILALPYSVVAATKVTVKELNNPL